MIELKEAIKTIMPILWDYQFPNAPSTSLISKETRESWWKDRDRYYEALNLLSEFADED